MRYILFNFVLQKYTNEKIITYFMCGLNFAI